MYILGRLAHRWPRWGRDVEVRVTGAGQRWERRTLVGGDFRAVGVGERCRLVWHSWYWGWGTQRQASTGPCGG